MREGRRDGYLILHSFYSNNNNNNYYKVSRRRLFFNLQFVTKNFIPISYNLLQIIIN